MAQRDIAFASFNLRNLQVPGQRVYFGEGWSDEEYHRKVEFTGRLMDRLRADVTGFQELWSGDALGDVLREARLSSTHAPLVDPDQPGNRIGCAAAVREDILVGDPEWITDFPPEMVLRAGGDDPQQADISVSLRSFSRPVLHFRVRPRDDTPEIHVFVCHFKSRRPTRVSKEPWFDKDTHGPFAESLGYAISTLRRTAEAAALRVILTRYMKGTGTPVVVIGDMNDGKLSNTLNILTEQPMYLAGMSEGGSDDALYAAQVLQEYRSTRDVYYTHVYQKERESLDHILVSQEFYDNARARLWVFDEMVVINDHLSFEDFDESGATDHGVVLARFKWAPAGVS